MPKGSDSSLVTKKGHENESNKKRIFKMVDDLFNSDSDEKDICECKETTVE